MNETCGKMSKNAVICYVCGILSETFWLFQFFTKKKAQ